MGAADPRAGGQALQPATASTAGRTANKPGQKSLFNCYAPSVSHTTIGLLSTSST